VPDSQKPRAFARGSFAALGLSMKVVITFLVALLLSACSLTTEEARVAIPGTSLTVVVLKDEKNMFRYQIFENGTAVSKQRVFGGYSSYSLSNPTLVESGSVVRISFQKPEGEIFLEFDRLAGQIVRDSNEADHPPVIEKPSANAEAQQALRGDAWKPTRASS
jgi:hypothetical protein